MSGLGDKKHPEDFRSGEAFGLLYENFHATMSQDEFEKRRREQIAKRR